MINVLPPEVKQEYRYAHRNVRLLHWLVGASLGVLGMLVIGAFGLIYMQQISHSFASQIDTSSAALKTQDLGQTRNTVKNISGSLQLAVKVLSKEVLFSKLLSRLAALTPDNVVLSGLTISQTDSAIDVTAKTTDYNAATQLQVNLAAADNQIFSKADIVSISCSSDSSPTTVADSKYPCTVIIRALFAKDTSFLFINNSAAKS